ncbi:MAG: iron ABC transporter permease [Rhodospirillaceae bacterium]|nr:MAG: iron ABC transporter permease [Rhodospirillaceae bacterium]
MPRPALIVILLAALIVLSVISLSAGKIWVPWSAWTSAGHDTRWVIIFELRLPRTILAIATGVALGMSGAALQGYTRNPLADPGVLGISTMASLGAVLTLYLSYFGAMGGATWLLPVGAMAGAIIGVVTLIMLAGAASSMLTFILAGVVLNMVSGAGVALALSLAPSPWAVNEIINWLMGSLADRSMEEVRFALPFIAAGCAFLVVASRALDALTLGETGARSLGIRLETTRFLLAVGVGLATGASVAVTGVIGFVGLVTPHLMRPLVGARPGALLIPSALAGAVVVLVADIAVRLTPSVTEVKLGVAMAALGGPFFLMLLISERRRLA